MKRTLTILLNLFVIFTMIAPAGGWAASPVEKQHAPANRLSPLEVDSRDHGPDPETIVILVGQSIVWTNNGAQSHTITEGDPIFSIYLPLVVRTAAGGWYARIR